MIANPMQWSRAHQVALVIAALIGVVISVIVGYLAHAAGADGAASFGYWIRHPARFGCFWWGLVGALVGIGVVYAKLLLNEPGSTK